MDIDAKDIISPWIILDRLITQMTPLSKQTKLLCKNDWAQALFCSLMIVIWIGGWDGGVILKQRKVSLNKRHVKKITVGKLSE